MKYFDVDFNKFIAKVLWNKFLNEQICMTFIRFNYELNFVKDAIHPIEPN